MNQEQQNVKRILVALDSSPSSLAALDAAAELATGFGAELVGLFVEDVNLLRLAELSFTQEVGLFSGRSRRLEIRHVERQFRSQASQARQALEQIAERTQLDCTFRVARGMIVSELLTAASEADMIILGKTGWSPVSQRRMGSTARSVTAHGTQLTLVLQHGVRLAQPVLTIYDGTPPAEKALAAAARLIPEKTGPLNVLILAAGSTQAEALQAEANRLLSQQNKKGRYLWRQTVNADRLAQLVDAEGYNLLVIPNTGSLNQNTLLALLDRLENPVLLVR
jgi:nucleotide-binding universal stress UspA family protein